MGALAVLVLLSRIASIFIPSRRFPQLLRVLVDLVQTPDGDALLGLVRADDAQVFLGAVEVEAA